MANRFLSAATAFVLLVCSPGVVLAEESTRAEAPPIDEATGKYTYLAVVQVDGASAADLYSRARAWVAKTYRSAQAVVQLEDDQAHRLVAKGVMKFQVDLPSVITPGKLQPVEMVVPHSVTIECKDGRYRFTLTDFEWVTSSLPKAPLESDVSKRMGNLLQGVDQDSKALIASLEAAMKVSGAEEW